MSPAFLLVAGVVALAVAGWIAADDARSAFLLAFVVGTNASAVIETQHGLQGPLLPLAAVVLLGALFRWWKRRDSAAEVPPPAALTGPLLLATIVLVAVVTSALSTAPTTSAEAVSRLLRDAVVIVAVVAVAHRPPGLRAALYGLAVAGATMGGITAVQWITGGQGSNVSGFGWWTTHDLAGTGTVPRAAGPFLNDPNSYAQHLLVAAAAAFGLALTRGGAKRMWLLAAGALTLVGLAATHSRTGFLGALVVVLVAALLVRPGPRHLLAGAAVGVVVLLGPFSIGTRLGTLSQVTEAGSGNVADSAIRGRASEMVAATRMVGDHPVTGVGYGAYHEEYLEYARSIGLDQRSEPRSAHSLPLEIAAEQGLVGVVVWGAFVVFAVTVMVRLHRRLRIDAVPLALTTTAFATTSVFLHDVHPRLMWLLFALIVGMGWWLATTERPVVPPTPIRRAVSRPVRAPLVAMVIQNYVPALGGAERQLANLAPLLVARGIEPIVVTRSMPGRPTRDEIDGITVLRIPVVGPKVLRSLMFVVQARIELARLRPDVVHAFDTLTPSTIALGHAQRHRCPVATKILRSGELGDLERLARKPGGAARRRRLLDGVDVFVAISTEIDHELAALGVGANRRAFIPNGVDTARFRPRPPGTRKVGGPIVVATGRLAPEKRLVELAARWHRVVEARPGAQLVLVGDGPEADRLAGVDGVVVLGRRDDVDEVLRSADVYVSASAAEGLSNSLLEAMASGLPCVVTDVGGVRDVIRDPREGVVVPSDDLDRLIDELVALLRDHDRRTAMGAWARRRVRLHHSLETTADELGALYGRMAASAHDAAPTALPAVRPAPYLVGAGAS